MMQRIMVLGILLVALTACSHTIHNPDMVQDQAQLVRNNWENIKLGMSIEEAKSLLGPPTVYRNKRCNCDECSPLGAEGRKIEKLWYVYKSVKEPNIFIYLAFRHGKLYDGWADTPAGEILLK